MRITLRYPSGSVGNKWALIELQGEVEAECGVLDGMELGQLSFQDNGTPQLIIGNHLLEGKRVALKKPFAIIRRKQEVADAMDVDAGLPPASYEVVSFATEKFLFRHRPKPITTTL